MPIHQDIEYEKLKWYCKDCSKSMGYNHPIYMFEEEQAVPSLNQKRPNNYTLEEEPNYPLKKVKG